MMALVKPDVASILDLWPSMAALADDLSIKPEMVRMWRYRGSIPADYDLRIVQSAYRRDLPLTLETLALARCLQAEAGSDGGGQT
jgi:hypothetical protein